MAKLNSYDRVTICQWYARGMYSQRELAEIYGVSRSTIRRVVQECAATLEKIPSFEPEVDAEVGRPSVGHTDPWFGPVRYNEAQKWASIVVAVGLAAYATWVLLHAI